MARGRVIEQSGKATTGKIISYTSGSIAANLVSLAFGTYVQFYYTDVLKGNTEWIGLAVTIQAVYATLLYPFLGYLSDRTHSRWGRRVPFIVYGAVPLGVAFMLVWLAPIPPSRVLLFTAYFFVTSILYDTLFNLTMVNWSALFPELFQSSKERAYASAWKQMFGIVGLVAGLALPRMIASAIGWPLMGALFGILCIATLLTTIPSMELKRRRQEQLARMAVADANMYMPVRQALKYTLVNRSFMTFVGMRFFVQLGFTLLTADLSFYAKYNLGISGTQQSILLLGTLVVALPLVYVWGVIVPKLGAFGSEVLAITLFGLALIPFIFAKTYVAALVAGLLIGIGLSGILMLTDVLISDVIDADHIATHHRREGMFYSIHGLILSLNTPVQALLTTLVLVLTGYTHSGRQPASALFGFRFLITFLPMLSLIIGLLFFIFYPLRKRQVAQNQKQLLTLEATQHSH
ncbi:MFS transporter [Alicyclobacillus mengziensis]|uniref:MFS transporter n=1 Tax=Alicyclobacillus mengziensis TaxID=2931921 RepID=A0A9X7W017_9BACL|nr:MFS transporter [Alicyclobacillus mengziensis]QSO47864.1 MFS transporter [Alicyclobacillus mengziensis]